MDNYRLFCELADRCEALLDDDDYAGMTEELSSGLRSGSVVLMIAPFRLLRIASSEIPGWESLVTELEFRTDKSLASGLHKKITK